jgi:hypothetical protein
LKHEPHTAILDRHSDDWADKLASSIVEVCLRRPDAAKREVAARLRLVRLEGEERGLVDALGCLRQSGMAS